MDQVEYSAAEMRIILQQLFPNRRLVLSQFTFYNQCGVARATGSTLRRGRRCYRLHDMLSIASILALKEEGIPLKNLEAAPLLIQDNAQKIFGSHGPCRLSGFGNQISLRISDQQYITNTALESLLENNISNHLFWSYELSQLARQLERVAFQGEMLEQQEIIEIEKAA